MWQRLLLLILMMPKGGDCIVASVVVSWFCVSQGKVASYRHKIKMKICKGRNKGWQEVCHKCGELIAVDKLEKLF